MDSKISQESKREVLRALRERYKQASKLESDTDRKKRASCDRHRRATRRELFIVFFP